MATRIPLALLATALACSFFAAPAHALRARVFVAKTGADTGNCSFSAPCQSLNFAYNAVLPGGEITILDSAGYEPLTINKALTITSPAGIEAGISANPGGNAITVAAAPGDVVTLRGLTLNGAGSGANGIVFTSGTRLAVIDCTITNYTAYGVLVQTQPRANGDTAVRVSNTNVSNNAGGIVLSTLTGGSGGIGSFIASLDHITADNNQDAIEVIAVGGEIQTTIKDSEIGSNKEIGLYVAGTSPSIPARVTILNVNFNVSPTGIYMNDYAYTYLSHVVISPISLNTTPYICAGTGAFVTADGTNVTNSFLFPLGGCAGLSPFPLF